MLVFSADPKNSPAISAFFHAELPVKLVSRDVLDGRHAGAFGLSEVLDMEAVANFHGGKRVLQPFDGGLGKRCSIEREHIGSVVWFLPKDVDR